MQPLIGFPKTAKIYSPHMHLEIEHHQVLNEAGMLCWILGNIKYWDDLLPQFIEKGIKLDAFINECILNLQHLDEFWEILWYLGNDGITINDTYEIASRLEGRQICGIIIERMGKCKNWDQLYTILRKDGDFRKMIKKKIRTEIKRCIH